MKATINIKWPWWIWVLLINLALLAITLFFKPLSTIVDKRFLYPFDLDREMNFASWWSAIQILTLGLINYELFSYSKGSIRFSWLILSLFFLFLSLDEIGSIHERFETSIFLIGIVGLLLTLVAVALLILYNQNCRPVVYGLILMLGMYALAFLIDHLDSWIGLTEIFLRIEILFEESLELFAVLAGLLVTAKQRRHPALSRTFQEVLPTSSRIRFLPALLLIGLFLHVIISILVVLKFDLNFRGNPSVWYPMAVLFLVFCTVYWEYSEAKSGRKSTWIFALTYFLLSSLATVYLVAPRPGSSTIYKFGLFSSFSFLFLCQLFLILFIYTQLPIKKDNPYVPILIGVGIFLSLNFVVDSLYLQFISAGVFAYAIANLFLVDIPKSVFVRNTAKKGLT